MRTFGLEAASAVEDEAWAAEAPVVREARRWIFSKVPDPTVCCLSDMCVTYAMILVAQTC